MKHGGQTKQKTHKRDIKKQTKPGVWGLVWSWWSISQRKVKKPELVREKERCRASKGLEKLKKHQQETLVLFVRKSFSEVGPKTGTYCEGQQRWQRLKQYPMCASLGYAINSDHQCHHSYITIIKILFLFFIVLRLSVSLHHLLFTLQFIGLGKSFLIVKEFSFLFFMNLLRR